MSYRTTKDIISEIESTAEMKGVHLDAVRPADDVESSGRVFRILAQDAETEADQIGTQVEYPDAPNADMSFSTSLSKRMSELKRYLRQNKPELVEGGESGETADGAETSDVEADEMSTEAESESRTDSVSVTETSTPTQPTQSSQLSSDLSLTIDVDLNDDALAQLESQLEAFVEDVEAESVDEARVDELEERIDQLEETLNNAFSAFGGVSPSHDNE